MVAAKAKRRRVVSDDEGVNSIELGTIPDTEALSDRLGLDEPVEHPPTTDDDFDMWTIPDLEEVSDGEDSDEFEVEENGEEDENGEDGDEEDEDEDEDTEENDNPDSYASMRAHADADREVHCPFY